MAKHVAMAERNEVGHLVRQHFIACEKRLKEVASDAAAAETERLRRALEEMSARAEAAAPSRSGISDDDGTQARRPHDATVLQEMARLPGADAAFLEKVVDFLGRHPAADADAAAKRPGYIFETSIGAVIDVRLKGLASSAADRAAALALAGCPTVDRRALTFWRRAYHHPEDAAARRATGRTPQAGLGDTCGISLAMRRAAVVAYETIRAERLTARIAWIREEKAAFRRDVHTASRARSNGKLN